jgi:glycosyltransferase involved in cell wall biosynthesis
MPLSKILVVSNMFPSEGHKSFGIFVQKFVIQMVHHGIACDLVVIKGRGRSAPEKIAKYLVFYFRLCIYLLFKKYELVYIHYVAHVAPLLLVLKLFRKPFLVCNFHGGDLIPDTKNEELLLPFSLQLARKSQLCVVPSHYYKRVLAERMKTDKPEILVSASSGVNSALFLPLEKKHQEPNIVTLGYVSRIDKEKGWDTFILAIQKLKKRDTGYNIKGLMVGTGAELPQLRSLIEDCNLANDIQLVGEVPNHELPAYFAQMDVFIFPTRRSSESLGLVGLEAMACGVPVIASEIGGITDYVKHEYTGLLFDPGNEDDLVEKIILWKSFPEGQKQQIIRAGIEMSHSFDEKGVSKALIDQLNQRFDAYQRR